MVTHQHTEVFDKKATTVATCYNLEKVFNSEPYKLPCDKTEY